MFGLGPAELIIFALIALVIFVIPLAALAYLIWGTFKRKK